MRAPWLPKARVEPSQRMQRGPKAKVEVPLLEPEQCLLPVRELALLNRL